MRDKEGLSLGICETSLELTNCARNGVDKIIWCVIMRTMVKCTIYKEGGRHAG